MTWKQCKEWIAEDGFKKKLTDEGYIYIRLGGAWICEHRFVVEQDLKRTLGPDEIVHHKNGNKSDNRRENLQVMTKSAHMKWHSTEDPIYREKQRINAIQRMKDPEIRKKLSESAKKQWEDPVYREEMSCKLSEAQLKRYEDNPQERVIKSEQAKQRWANPEIRAKMVLSLTDFARERAKDPEYRKKLSAWQLDKPKSVVAVEANKAQAKKRQQKVRLLYATYLTLGGNAIPYWNRTSPKLLEEMVQNLEQFKRAV